MGQDIHAGPSSFNRPFKLAVAPFIYPPAPSLSADATVSTKYPRNGRHTASHASSRCSRPADAVLGEPPGPKKQARREAFENEQKQEVSADRDDGGGCR
eukprot:scaffold7095_cov260-Pinguiococcus_pyrenoidosus.AAC.8